MKSDNPLIHLSLLHTILQSYRSYVSISLQSPITMPDPMVELAKTRTPSSAAEWYEPSQSSASGYRRMIEVPEGKKKSGGGLLKVKKKVSWADLPAMREEVWGVEQQDNDHVSEEFWIQ